MPILINDNTARVQYTATAGQTVFNLTFGTAYVPGTNNLDVFRNGQLLYSGDYTETDTDTITMTSFAASVGDKMLFVIRDNIGITAVVDQQLRTDLANASDPVKGAAMVGNIPVGTIAATTVQGAINEIVSDLAASGGSALVGFLQAGTGATTRTGQSKFREVVSVKDFGAVGDFVSSTGVGTNDLVAIQAAFDYAASIGNCKVIIPAGKYYLGAGTHPNAAANTNIQLLLGSQTVANAANNITVDFQGTLYTGLAGARMLVIANANNISMNPKLIAYAGGALGATREYDWPLVIGYRGSGEC